MQEKILKLSPEQLEAAKIAAESTKQEDTLTHLRPSFVAPQIGANGEIEMVKVEAESKGYVSAEQYEELYSLLSSHAPEGRVITNAEFSHFVGVMVSTASLLKDFAEANLEGSVKERLDKIKLISAQTHDVIMALLGQK